MRYHPFSLGNWNCYVLEDRSKVIPLIEEFDEDKRKQALHCHISHGAKDEMVEIGYNYLLLDTGERKILIDAGMKDKGLVASLEAAGYAPPDVDMVVITHGDDDHVSGLVHFPEAQVVLPKKCFDLWTNAESRQRLNREYEKALGKVISSDRVAYEIEMRNSFGGEVLPGIDERLVLVDDHQEFLPGIKMIPTPGHRSDHYCVMIENAGERLMVLSDAFRHGFQFKRSNLASVYDADESTWSESVEYIKSLDPERKSIYFATHFSFPALKTFQDGLLLDKP